MTLLRALDYEDLVIKARRIHRAPATPPLGARCGREMLAPRVTVGGPRSRAQLRELPAHEAARHNFAQPHANHAA